MKYRNYRQDPATLTLYPKQITSSDADLALMQYLGPITCPAAANYPYDSPSKYIIHLPEIIDQSDLVTRPLLLYKNSISPSNLLTKVSGDPTGETDSYQLCNSKSFMRDAIFLSSDLAGLQICYDYYGLGTCENADDEIFGVVGPWDMDADGSFDATTIEGRTLTLDELKRIRHIDILIGRQYYSGGNHIFPLYAGGYWGSNILSGGLFLSRTTGGIFDTSTFSSAYAYMHIIMSRIRDY